MFAAMGDEPTPGGPLTEERIKTLGVVKMNDYIKSGTRQQFWEEYYVRVIMQVTAMLFSSAEGSGTVPLGHFVKTVSKMIKVHFCLFLLFLDVTFAQNSKVNFCLKSFRPKSSMIKLIPGLGIQFT
jgi:hypothetical protein